jgi:hypothetical protein
MALLCWWSSEQLSRARSAAFGGVMLDAGNQQWLDLRRLRESADQYLAKSGVSLLRDTEVTANISTTGESNLVEFFYFQDYDRIAHVVTLDKHGKVTAHSSSIAREARKPLSIDVIRTTNGNTR